MPVDLDYFTDGQPVDRESLCDCPLEYIPLSLNSSLYKTFYRGYIQLFEIIHTILETTKAPLTKSGVQSSVQQNSFEFGDASFYYVKGGRTEYAFDALTDGSMGNGMVDIVYTGEGRSCDDYINLPECENDLEYGLVRYMLGLDPTVRWGPYTDEDVVFFRPEDNGPDMVDSSDEEEYYSEENDGTASDD